MDSGDGDFQTFLNIEYLCDQLRNSRRTDPEETPNGKCFIRVYNVKVKQVTHFHYATPTNRHSNFVQQRTYGIASLTIEEGVGIAATF